MKKTFLQSAFTFITLIVFAAGLLAQSTITGTVTYHEKSDVPVGNVTVLLVDQNGTVLDQYITEQDGNYSFENVANGDYTIQAETNQPAGGVDLNDAFEILLYLNNLTTFTPIQMLAADVTGDGQVNMDDYYSIQTGWYQTGYPQNVEDWAFQPVNISVAKGDVKAAGGPYSTGTGDTEGSFMPGNKPGNLDFIRNTSVEVNVMEEFEIELTSAMATSLNGLGLNLNFKNDFVEILDVHSTLPGMTFNLAGNNLSMNWIDETMASTAIHSGQALATLKIRALKAFNETQQNIFRLNTNSHLLDAKGHTLKQGSIELPMLTAKGIEVELGQNFPNPFNNQTTICYSLPTEGHVAIKIYNLTGQMIQELMNQNQEAGNHTLSVSANNLKPGMYFYQLQFDGAQYFNASKTFTVVE